MSSCNSVPPQEENQAPAERTGGTGGRLEGATIHRLMVVIVLIVVLWTFIYNLFVKQQPPVRAFFRILDTISDDLVMGSLLTLLVGVGIVVVFSITKLYTQIIANIYSFKIIEDLVYDYLRKGQLRAFLVRLLNFQDQPIPESHCPTRVGSLLFAFSFIYMMSWIYLLLFSEALFFVSWSAGVDLPITEKNLLLLPTLALSIPFSARVMAYLRYPYAQDYADFMPGAVFVLLIVSALGYLFQSDDQKFFLVQVFQHRTYLAAFLRNGVFLAFIPVFFEAMFWLFELNGLSREMEEQQETKEASTSDLLRASEQRRTDRSRDAM